MFESFFFRAREAFLLIDASGSIIDANRSACQFLKKDRHEIAGLPADYLFETEVLDDMFRMADRQDAWTDSFVTRVVANDEVADMRAIKLRPADKSTLYSVELSHETLERRAVTRLQDDLESAKINAQQERRASSTLRTTNERLTSFAHRVAHDVRGPLRNIRMALELYRDDEEHVELETREELLAMAEASAGELERLLIGLLNYSTSSSRGLARQEVNVSEIVQSVGASLMAPGDGDWLEVGDLPIVHADRALMEIVLQNLLSNALKFKSDDRPLKVEILATGEGESAEIVVRDNGIGFPEDAAEQIFELFGRLRTDREGAGIGLATCAELIAQHGWTIHAFGAPDEGAEFRISVPWKDVVQLREPKADAVD
ncbi:PAS domain-containing sensor histidine kinase [Ponticaulis sp.]|uniref:sensor histidine kinase n=1 Tax=Ponticaulis sp. TaxID=2020902 RepID=UPI000C4B55B2|nr:PAS domain-containing sensor histidine kinase [Ponticaulis sp.]MBN02606.1 hypothetical protein [Ponticaulis sp.]|tara:strand:- start:325 stop:1443 length:1119 start_codon:yes stop_codon:yes gene_type:complete